MGVLLVEDDQRLVRMLRQLLEDEGYTVDTAVDGCLGERQALAEVRQRDRRSTRCFPAKTASRFAKPSARAR